LLAFFFHGLNILYPLPRRQVSVEPLLQATTSPDSYPAISTPPGMEAPRVLQYRVLDPIEEEAMKQSMGELARASDRQAYTFHLDPALVERVREEIGEVDVVRSIEAALAAALDYQKWVREVAAGSRRVLS
jgi:hypothetical protein